MPYMLPYGSWEKKYEYFIVYGPVLSLNPEKLRHFNNIPKCISLTKHRALLPVCNLSITFDFKCITTCVPTSLPVKCLPLLLCKLAPGKRILSNGYGSLLDVHATALFVLIIFDISQAAYSLFDGQSIKK